MSIRNHKEIKISNLLKDKFIKLELEASDKKSVILELVELINESKKIKNKKKFLKAILEREKLGSTGIGNGVAIPHAKSREVKDFVVVFARKSKGIDFGALDGEKTYLFFAIASPQEKVGNHLKILSEISHIVRDKFIVERLKKAKDKKEILRLISNKGST